MVDAKTRKRIGIFNIAIASAIVVRIALGKEPDIANAVMAAIICTLNSADVLYNYEESGDE